MINREFPESWIKLQLGEVVSYGKTNKIEPIEITDDTWVLELEDIEKNISKINKHVTFAERKSKSTKNKFEKGDILYGKLRPYLNKIILAPDAGVCTTEIIPLSGGRHIDNRYIFYWLKHPEFLAYVKQVSYGVNMPRLGTKDGLAAPFLIAALAEQKQIATKLDELLAQVDTIKTRLDAIPTILKRFRQSVLAAAVSGRLTEEWRSLSKDMVEPWVEEPATTLCLKVQSGSTPKNRPFDQGGTIPFLKVYNIVGQKIDFDFRPQFVTQDVHQGKLKRSIAYPGDVLMNIVGPPLGKVAILTVQYPEWNLNQAVTLFRVNPSKLLSKFLYYVLREGTLVRSVMHETKGIVGQVNISLTQCRESMIPKPSILEQKEIVRRVEQLFTFADQVEQRVTDAQSRVNNLTQSILAKAFRGDLTAEWREQNASLISGENSAEILLRRIKAERQSSLLNKQTRKKRA